MTAEYVTMVNQQMDELEQQLTSANAIVIFMLMNTEGGRMEIPIQTLREAVVGQHGYEVSQSEEGTLVIELA